MSIAAKIIPLYGHQTNSVSREKIRVESSGEFGQVSAKIGSPVDFISISGVFPVLSFPLPGELKLSCPGLNVENIRMISISPTGDNRSPYPVSDTCLSGSRYRYDIQLY